jgi:transcriptional regulator with XRE-family HTH domain
MDIGFALWLLRESLGMTQRQIASRMKTSRQQVGDLENGQPATIATLFRIAYALRVTPHCLLLIAEARQMKSGLPLKRKETKLSEPHTAQPQSGKSTSALRENWPGETARAELRVAKAPNTAPIELFHIR